jgi:ketosteroid isomerase-like protein
MPDFFLGEWLRLANTRVQDFGNLAVVTGRLVEKAQYKNADISGTYRFTDVWVKRQDKWQHVAGQETLVSTPAEASASGASDVANVKATLVTLINFQRQYDAGSVDKLLDPQFVYVSNDGSVVSRTEFINLTDREKNPFDALEVTDVQVQVSGDTAVATGIIHEKGLLYGKPYEFHGRTLITYARRRGRWLCLAIHDWVMRTLREWVGHENLETR